MAVWGYELRTSERYFQHSKIKFVSPRGHVKSAIYTLRKCLKRYTSLAYVQRRK